MKFLADENIPSLLIRTLQKIGHNVKRAKTTGADMTVALAAQKEKRIIVTLDKDFTNTVLFPPSQFNIIQISIHPPYKDTVCRAVMELLKEFPSQELTGLIILTKEGPIRIRK